MKGKNSDYEPIFIPYDDENLEHVMAGNDYGQVDSGSKKSAWSEIESKEYPDFVFEVGLKISRHPFLKVISVL